MLRCLRRTGAYLLRLRHHNRIDSPVPIRRTSSSANTRPPGLEPSVLDPGRIFSDPESQLSSLHVKAHPPPLPQQAHTHPGRNLRFTIQGVSSLPTMCRNEDLPTVFYLTPHPVHHVTIDTQPVVTAARSHMQPADSSRFVSSGVITLLRGFVRPHIPLGYRLVTVPRREFMRHRISATRNEPQVSTKNAVAFC